MNTIPTLLVSYLKLVSFNKSRLTAFHFIPIKRIVHLKIQISLQLVYNLSYQSHLNECLLILHQKVYCNAV